VLRHRFILAQIKPTALNTFHCRYFKFDAAD
jgi:hypothetical protein